MEKIYIIGKRVGENIECCTGDFVTVEGEAVTGVMSFGTYEHAHKLLTATFADDPEMEVLEVDTANIAGLDCEFILVNEDTQWATDQTLA
jgi:N-dimethylarginine dimethylaminohydrolase